MDCQQNMNMIGHDNRMINLQSREMSGKAEQMIMGNLSKTVQIGGLAKQTMLLICAYCDKIGCGSKIVKSFQALAFAYRIGHDTSHFRMGFATGGTGKPVPYEMCG